MNTVCIPFERPVFTFRTAVIQEVEDRGQDDEKDKEDESAQPGHAGLTRPQLGRRRHHSREEVSILDSSL